MASGTYFSSSSSSSSDHAKERGIFFGLLLVAAGLLLLSFNFGWVAPALKSVIFSWPVIFVLIGIVGFSRKRFFAPLFWLILGFFFLIPRIAAVYPDSFPGVDFDFAHKYWPLLLIIFGMGYILKRISNKRRPYRKDAFHFHKTEEMSGYFEKRVAFGGAKNIFLDPVFNGSSFSVVFGGVELDLRRTALPEGETYINIDAVFGGVVLYIPEDWHVETKLLKAVLGDIQDKRTITRPPGNSKKLIVQGDLVFGGCEIR